MNTKLLQVWQTTGQAEKTPEEMAATCQQYGYGGVLVKALDGTAWMSNFDPGGLGSAEQVAEWAEFFRGVDLKMLCWVNPLQQNTGAQADMAAAIGNACDGLAFDTEPYASFWGVGAPAGLADSYMTRLRSGLNDPDLPRIWQPDPRPERLAELLPDEWAQHMTIIATQDYVTDFYWTPSAQAMRGLLDQTQANAARFGLAPWSTLPGLAGADLLPADAISELEGFVVWRMGTTGPGTLSWLGSIGLSDPVDPTPVSDCSDYQAKINDLVVQFADTVDVHVYDALYAELNRRNAKGVKLPPRPKAIKAIADDAEARRVQYLGERPAGDALRKAAQRARLEGGPDTLTNEGANPHPED